MQKSKNTDSSANMSNTKLKQNKDVTYAGQREFKASVIQHVFILFIIKIMLNKH